MTFVRMLLIIFVIVQACADVIPYDKLEYPPLAMQARIQGEVFVVVIHGSQTEKIEIVRVLTGHPLLVPEATRNASKWLFTSAKSNLSIIVYTFYLLPRKYDVKQELIGDKFERFFHRLFRQPLIREVEVSSCGDIPTSIKIYRDGADEYLYLPIWRVMFMVPAPCLVTMQ